MAESPAHKFGQLIGEFIECVLQPLLEEFCEKNGLYLDHKRKDRRARSGKKVTWEDRYGNTHDLDFVIERDGTDDTFGRPVAFIETAWRRYTKHSRNKAQEIQGAISHIAEKYNQNNPFLGVVLAGHFTDGSIQQLRSHGFQVLLFPYNSIVEAFDSENININFGEETPDAEFSNAVNLIENMSLEQKQRIRQIIAEKNTDAINGFFDALKKRFERNLTRIVVIPLFGKVNVFSSIEDAILFLDENMMFEGSVEFLKYEIRVEFSNGDKVEAFLESKDKVKEFFEFVSRQ